MTEMTTASNGTATGLSVHDERWQKHERLMAFLDSAEAASMTPAEIAEKVGVHITTVQKNLVKRNGSGPRGGEVHLRNGEAWRRIERLGMRNPGQEFTIQQIAAELKLDEETVRKNMISHGLMPTVPSGGRGKAGRWILAEADGPGEEEAMSPASTEAGQPEAEVQAPAITFVGYATDGTPLGTVTGMQLVWRLKLDRPV